MVEAVVCDWLRLVSVVSVLGRFTTTTSMYRSLVLLLKRETNLRLYVCTLKIKFLYRQKHDEMLVFYLH